MVWLLKRKNLIPVKAIFTVVQQQDCLPFLFDRRRLPPIWLCKLLFSCTSHSTGLSIENVAILLKPVASKILTDLLWVSLSGSCDHLLVWPSPSEHIVFDLEKWIREALYLLSCWSYFALNRIWILSTKADLGNAAI